MIEELEASPENWQAARNNPQKAWAFRLARREFDSRGIGMSMSQRDMWREALGVDRKAKPETVLDIVRI